MKIFLEKLKLYFKPVPFKIDEKEKIVKIIFSPLNVNAKGFARANTFRCKRDNLSVNRLDYTTLNFCKRQGVLLEKSANLSDKKYYGIALLFAKEIRLFANLFHKPLRFNKAHAEITVGYSKELKVGEVNDAEYIYITDELAKKARLYKDDKIDSKRWEADNVDEILNLQI